MVFTSNTHIRRILWRNAGDERKFSSISFNQHLF
jgi:hypothetical protein